MTTSNDQQHDWEEQESGSAVNASQWVHRCRRCGLMRATIDTDAMGMVFWNYVVENGVVTNPMCYIDSCDEMMMRKVLG